MNHSNFIPYHNRHIQFSVNNGPVQSGVVVDMAQFRTDGVMTTEYTFIPTGNMIEFKKTSDPEKRKSLSGKVDIAQITWVEPLNW